MIGPDASDRELVAAIQAHGDERAFRFLYQRHTPALYRTAHRLTNNRDGAAEDLVHDTWVRAATRFGEFEWRASLRTWLTGILLNGIRELRRRWAREAGATTDDPDWHPATPAPLDARLDLEGAILALPPGYREAIVLHDIEGYTHEDIARITGNDVGTSKSQLARARRSLRRWLAPEEDTA